LKIKKKYFQKNLLQRVSEKQLVRRRQLPDLLRVQDSDQLGARHPRAISVAEAVHERDPVGQRSDNAVQMFQDLELIL
jgi:hypothetical protein